MGMYDGSMIVDIGELHNCQLDVSVSVEVVKSVVLPLTHSYDMNNLPPIQLSIVLPATYLASDSPEGSLPECTISGAWLSREQSERLRGSLIKIATESNGGLGRSWHRVSLAPVSFASIAPGSCPVSVLWAAASCCAWSASPWSAGCRR